jgi:16S rRNA (cytosine967-C5)-methyltransferase
VLMAVTTRDAYANLLLGPSLREAGLTGQDAAFVTELVYGTLRSRGSYDAIIGLCADRDLGKIDPAVLEVLRIGTHQLLGMRTKPHAAVATTVDLAVDVAGRRPAGFVNAVLRRIAPRDQEAWLGIVAPDRAADLVGHLSVRYSHPRWIVTAFAEALGEQPGGGLTETEAVLAADSARPRVHLAAVPGLAGQADLCSAGGATAARWSPYGAYLSHGDPGAIEAVVQHRAGVQDEASQLAALALTLAPPGAGGSPGSEGQRWLDLCAGPGGKARLLAGLAAGQGARLLAVDRHEHRAELAAEAVSRIKVAQVVTADGLEPSWRPGSFDRVLADVPCSGLGSLRRRPEVRWRRDPGDLAALGRLQRGLLDAAIHSAGRGGVVGYVTCSPHLAETRQVLADVIAAHRQVEVLDAPAVLSEVPDLRCPAPYSRYAQFWPHRHGTDAIFVALLRLTG